MAVNPRNTVTHDAAKVSADGERTAAALAAIKAGREEDAKALIGEGLNPKLSHGGLFEILTAAVHCGRWTFAAWLVSQDTTHVLSGLLEKAIDDNEPAFIEEYLRTWPDGLYMESNRHAHADDHLVRYAREKGRDEIVKLFIEYLEE
jgi:hypothetical protein